MCTRLDGRPVCAPEGFSECSDTVAPDLTTSETKESFRANPPYGGSECQGRFLYEVPVTEGVDAGFGRAGRDLFLLSVWDITRIDTRQECENVVIDVAVRRELASGAWEQWDVFKVVGAWGSACETVSCGGGKGPEGKPNEVVGAPQTWVDTGDTQRVRVAVSAYDRSCTQQPLVLGASDTL